MRGITVPVVLFYLSLEGISVSNALIVFDFAKPKAFDKYSAWTTMRAEG